MVIVAFIVANYGLIKLIRFVSRISAQLLKKYKYFLFDTPK